MTTTKIVEEKTCVNNDGDKSKENTLKRKNSKKKKSHPQDETKLFVDEIDKALHEIKLIEEQEKNRVLQGSLKRRSSKKSKNQNQNELDGHNDDNKHAKDKEFQSPRTVST